MPLEMIPKIGLKASREPPRDFKTMKICSSNNSSSNSSSTTLYGRKLLAKNLRPAVFLPIFEKFETRADLEGLKLDEIEVANSLASDGPL